MALITKEVVKRVEVFEGMTEMARSKISNRSLKLFTFSGIYHATKILLSQKQGIPFAEKLPWQLNSGLRLPSNIPDWGRAKKARNQPGGAARRHAFTLMRSPCRRWPERGDPFSRSIEGNGASDCRRSDKLDWSRSNKQLWEGRAMIAGRLSKSNINILLTGNVVKQHLKLPLTADEQDADERLNAEENRVSQRREELLPSVPVEVGSRIRRDLSAI